MGYKDDFYAHPGSLGFGREPEADLAQFARKAPLWSAHFGRWLPADRGAAILDAGCGAGGLVWWLHRRGYANAAGIDISAENVRVAASLGVGQVAQADLREHLAARPGAYDQIFMRDVLEHFPKEQVIELLGLVHGALKGGGRLVLQVPNGESPLFGRLRYGDFTHELAFTASSLAQLFDRTGFSVVRFCASPPVAGGLRSGLRALLWVPVEWMFKVLLWIESGPGPRVVTQNIIAVAAKR